MSETVQPDASGQKKGKKMVKKAKKRPYKYRKRPSKAVKAHKCTKVEYENRVNRVLDMLLSGLTRRQILQNVANNPQFATWKVADRMVDEYIAAATGEVLKMAEVKRDELFADCLAKYRYLYANLIAQQDFKGASAIIDRITELTGIKVLRSEVSITTPQLNITVPDEETKAEVLKLQ